MHIFRSSRLRINSCKRQSSIILRMIIICFKGPFGLRKSKGEKRQKIAFRSPGNLTCVKNSLEKKLVLKSPLTQFLVCPGPCPYHMGIRSQMFFSYCQCYCNTPFLGYVPRYVSRFFRPIVSIFFQYLFLGCDCLYYLVSDLDSQT